jgi:hypothetical protein
VVNSHSNSLLRLFWTVVAFAQNVSAVYNIFSQSEKKNELRAMPDLLYTERIDTE